MATRILKVEVIDTLYDKFRNVVTDKKGPWRGSKQSSDKAFQTAIEAALQQFLDSLQSSASDSRDKS